MNSVKLQGKQSTYKNPSHFYILTTKKRKEENNFVSNGIKKNKILRNKFKETKDLYTKNYKILMTEMEDTNKWIDSLCS